MGVICVAVAANAQADPKRIIPGRQLGKLNIGNLMEDMKWLKKPDYGDASSGHQWQTWDAKKPDPRNGKIINSLDVYSSLNASGKYEIRLIRSTSPTFATSDKIKVGSEFKDIKKEFPKIAKVAEYGSPQFSASVSVYEDSVKGVAFEFKQGLDAQAGRHDKCLSIWVFEPGLDLKHEYYPPILYLVAKPGLKKSAKQSSK